MKTLLAPVRGQLIAGCLLSLIAALTAFIPFIAVAELGRELLGAHRDSVIWTATIVGVVSMPLSVAAYVAAIGLCHRADAEFRFETRRTIAANLATVPLGWFLTGGSARVKKSISDDVASVHTLVAHVIPDFIMIAVAPVAGIVYLFVTDWRLALALAVYLVAVPAIVMPRMQRVFDAHNDEYEAAQRDVATATVELVDGISVIKTFGLSEKTFVRFSAAVRRSVDVTTAWMAGIGRPVNVMSIAFAPGTLLIVITAVGTAMVVADWMQPAQLLPFLVVGVGLPASYMRMAQLNYPIRDAQVAAGNIGDLLRVAPLPEPVTPARPVGGQVELEDIRFGYGPRRVVIDGVRVTLRAGTLTAVVGPSGSGKSTLARLIPRFYDVEAGSVLVGGADVRDTAAIDLLSHTALVFQDVVLLRETIADNIRLANPDATDDEVVAAAKAAAIYDEIAVLPEGFDTVVDGDILSGGQKQRLTIARALLTDAPIVVLDEPTAYADVENEAKIQEALSRLLADKTVLMIAHRLHTIAGADQILVLDAGRVVESGTHDELVGNADGWYSRMWALQGGTR